MSELVANAILHAGTSIGVVIRRDGERIRIEVHDGDPVEAARKYYSTMATTGRGLMLVERLSDAWGVTSVADGKSVWFELNQRPDGGREDPNLVAFDQFSVDAEELAALQNPGSWGGGGSEGGGAADAERRDPRTLVRVERR